MILLLPKRWILPCVFLALATLTFFSVLKTGESVAVTASQEMTVAISPVFVLDAGHGGADGGASAASGTLESDINLAVTLRTRDMFSLIGRPTVLTRTGQESLADDPAATLRQQKVSDTKNRVALINSVDNARLISIHQNTLAGHGSVHGAQVFYSDTDGSEPLAEGIQQALNAVINRNNTKGKKPISKDIYLMAHVTCPAVLVECGFLSNAAEAERLQSQDYQTLLAMIICCAAVECE